MRIKIEDIPQGVQIKDITIELNVCLTHGVQQSQPTVQIVKQVESVPEPHESREPLPIPEEMNLNF